MTRLSSGSSDRAYDPVAKSLHWIVFLLLAAQYAVGSIMPHIGRHTPDESWVAWHMSIGATIPCFSVVVRLAWRIAHPVALAPGMPAWQARFGSLDPLAALCPGAGDGHSGLGRGQLPGLGGFEYMFGLIPLPAIAAKEGAAWAHEAGDIHDWLLYVLAAVIGLHVAGALYHQYVMRDDELRRML